MDVTANNIANMNTTAFQKESVMFKEFQVTLQNVNSPTGNTISFIQDVGSKRSFAAGNFIPTSNNLDVAISGQGYLTMETPDGEPRYTRNGHLSINEDGMLVGSGGALVIGEAGGPIPIGAEDTDISISADGTINSSAGPLGKIGLVEFTQEQRNGLKKVGHSLYSSDQIPNAAENSSLTQGMLESSNVNAIEEMTNMLETLRSYQSVQNMMKSYLELKNNSLRTIASVG
jgi:flagellar basal-body rod protein FlgF